MGVWTMSYSVARKTWTVAMTLLLSYVSRTRNEYVQKALNCLKL